MPSAKSAIGTSDSPSFRALYAPADEDLAAALLALAAAAWRYRRAFPLAGYGFFVFLVLLSPTSSILPIKDPIADRRMYLPMLGLILIAIDLLRRWKVERLFAWMQNYRRLVTRWEYHIENFLGFVQLACLLMLLRHL